ncbi:kelch repeat-containing protein [Aquimarina sp. MMG016]|uniref:Kelch repeat-containing protein n=1 Tax=Aquimarina sp. MMG016 TaxID=2822690 RepID=UPI001B3A509D|nr:kelch repeat-containing protein [Aquimarina sp. MMG016]MBQ4819428.1 galactose oxidase [Aquimarina sp. MMG016]
MKKTNKRRKPLLLKHLEIGIILCSFIMITSCSSDDDEDDKLGNWVNRSVFDGTPRSSAVSFTIDNLGYMGTGFDGDDYLSDFWVYDIEGNFWRQLADFASISVDQTQSPRSSAVAFTIANEGYIGLGFDGDNELGDFYKYDPALNEWAPITSFEGTARRGAVAFSSDTSGYVGTGFDGDNDKKDFWKYDPIADDWIELVGFGGSKRRDATSFTIEDKVYMGTGVSNGINQDDFWVFDINTEVWSPLTDLDTDDYDVRRSNATGFSIGNRGYIACGDTGVGIANSVWEYNPDTDFWEEKTSFEGFTRRDAISFYNDSRAFVALGRSGTLYLDDNWEFFPFEIENEDD